MLARQTWSPGAYLPRWGLLQPPRLLFTNHIQCSENAIGSIYSVLNKCCGQVMSEEQRPGTLMLTVPLCSTRGRLRAVNLMVVILLLHMY